MLLRGPLEVVARAVAIAAAAALCGCGGDEASADGGVSEAGPIGDRDSAANADTGPGTPDDGSAPADSGGDGGPLVGPPPSTLPVSYTRPDVGTPETPAELDAATDQLIALLGDTRYFDVVDERIHGWPQNAGGYWFGTFWSGVSVVKAGGAVSYVHGANGADNNGMRTAPFLEGACYATLIAGKPVPAALVSRIARGTSSWALAIERSAAQKTPRMLARAHYGQSVTSTTGGRSLFIDTSLDRPGVDNGATSYVHVPSNPTFGDIYIKNTRSKDDMGAIFRSIAQAQACAPRLSVAAQADLAQMRALYTEYSLQVEADGWGIRTIDASLADSVPPASQTLAHYLLLDNIECPGVLMMRLLGHAGDPGTVSCADGISTTEQLTASSMNGSVRQILRTHHEAAVNMAWLTGQTAAGLDLLKGLASRVSSEVALATQPSPPANTNPTDIAALVMHSANAGVPLTSTEVRFVHARLALAYAAYRAPAALPTYHVFDAATPDGTYSYEPGGDGLSFGDIGVLLGSCASPWRNVAGQPLLDCNRLVAALSK